MISIIIFTCTRLDVPALKAWVMITSFTEKYMHQQFWRDQTLYELEKITPGVSSTVNFHYNATLDMQRLLGLE